MPYSYSEAGLGCWSESFLPGNPRPLSMQVVTKLLRGQRRRRQRKGSCSAFLAAPGALVLSCARIPAVCRTHSLAAGQSRRRPTLLSHSPDSSLMTRDFERSALFLARYRRLLLTFHPTAAQSLVAWRSWSPWTSRHTTSLSASARAL